MATSKPVTAIYESLPKLAKVILQLFFGALIGGIYRIIRFVEKNNTTTLIVGILALIPPIDVFFWIFDLITEITSNEITLLAD